MVNECLIFYGINVGKCTNPMDPSWVIKQYNHPFCFRNFSGVETLTRISAINSRIQCVIYLPTFTIKNDPISSNFRCELLVLGECNSLGGGGVKHFLSCSTRTLGKMKSPILT